VRLFQRAGLFVLALVVIGLPVGSFGPASAASPTALGGEAPCLSALAAGASSTRMTPGSRHRPDTSPVTAADLAALPAKQTRRTYVNREVRPSLAARISLPVYVHVIQGRHRGEKSVTGKRVRALIATLNGGMAGVQSEYSAPLRYRFLLRKIDYTTNDRWYHAYLFGPNDKAAKRALHVGGPRTLNLYINNGGPKNSPILGWARFPWQYASTPKLDSVSINNVSMRGGSARGYNLGDTVIHEVGHWLGLLHTFQGGCAAPNDLVSDTPAESQPSFRCAYGRNTCPDDPGPDPIFNFMDYSYDYCMKRFTAGQVRRIDVAMEKWRL
jgi:hypothetical protein